MAERLAYVNGKVVPESQAVVSVYDIGFIAGHAVFERTRTFNGVFFRLDDHLERLYRSLKVTRLTAGMTLEEMRAITLDLAEKNRPLLGPNDDYSVGHYVTRGTGDGRPGVVIFCEPIPFKMFAQGYIDGAHVVTPATRQMPPDVIDPKLKTTSRMYLWIADCEAHLVDPKAYALLLDLQGNVAEISPASFFIVRGRKIVTPPERSILAGITRRVAMELAGECELGVEEANFQVYDVITADEAFLTTTTRCIMPVTRINGVPIGSGKPGPVVGQLQSAWIKSYHVDFMKQALAHLQS